AIEVSLRRGQRGAVVSVQGVGAGQSENRNAGVEQGAVIGLHDVVATHTANAGAQHGTRGIAVGFTRLNGGLFAHHAVAFHFLHLVVAIGNKPVAAAQGGALQAVVVNADMVGKHIALFFRQRLLRQIFRFYRYHNAVTEVHARSSAFRSSIPGSVSRPKSQTASAMRTYSCRVKRSGRSVVSMPMAS